MDIEAALSIQVSNSFTANRINSMSLYRRPTSPHWWIRFQLNGTEIRLSTKTANRREAEEFETVARTRAWRLFRLGEKPPFPWSEASKRWLSETRKRSKERDIIILGWFNRHLGTCDVKEQATAEVGQERALRKPPLGQVPPAAEGARLRGFQ